MMKPRASVGLLLLAAGWAAGAVDCMPGSAKAEDAAPPVSLSVRETLDVWNNAAGGVRTGSVVLNKLQVAGFIEGDAFGAPGVRLHAQIFRTDGQGLSERVGDIQTVSNIEAPRMTRLFEAWIEKRFGDGERSLTIRGGLLDLNAGFDSIEAAGQFINSSHGIGPDLSKSGVSGPSIFPVSAAAVRLAWRPSKTWTWRAAVFDGVAGEPSAPDAFARVRLRRTDGVLAISQVDYRISEAVTFEAGAWRYSQAAPGLDGLPTSSGHDQGLYVSLAGAVPNAKGWAGWVRAGIADDTSQIVDGYVGLGLVRTGPFRSRADDQLGLAIGSAHIGGPARAAFQLSRSETTIEAYYQLPLSGGLAIQPDVQYVLNPAGQSGARDALVVGIRFAISGEFSKPVAGGRTP